VYVLMVVSLMGVLPIASILVEVRFFGRAFTAEVARRWFVFWAVGVRLLTAGMSQIIQPGFTAGEILGLESDDALFVVRELGFANTAIGLAGVASVAALGWSVPLALIGAVFYGFAGAHHALHGDRGLLQNVAMMSDIFIATVLLALWIAALHARQQGGPSNGQG
jgi:hypothetical protein